MKTHLGWLVGLTWAALASAEPRLIHLGTSFDPLEGLHGAPAGATSAVEGEVAGIVQARSDEGARRLRVLLPKSGLQVLAPVEDAAWLVRGASAALRDAAALPDVRWAGALTPGMKLGSSARRLLDSASAKESRPAEVRLDILLVPGAKAGGWRDVIARIPGVRVLHVETDPLPQLTLMLSPGAAGDVLGALSSLSDVLAITALTPRRPCMEDAIWFAQSGDDLTQDADYAISAPLFAKGLTGRGMMLALADEGLENDECRFTYGSAREEAAWAAGPSSSSMGVTVPQEQPLAGTTPVARSRERKVVAYYLQSGAAFGESARHHGSACAVIAMGDRPDALAARPLVRDLGGRSQHAYSDPAAGRWTWGQELRPDIAPRVDDPLADDPALPDTHGNLVEHHGSIDGIAPGAQLVMQDIGDAAGDLTADVTVSQMIRQAALTGATTWLAPWGSDPCTDCYLGDANDADAATWMHRDIVVVAAAGNGGALGPDSGVVQAKNALVIGATVAPADPSCPLPGDCPAPTPRLGEAVASFSAIGVGSRALLPHLVAPGVLDLGDLPSMPVSPATPAQPGDFACAAAGGGSRVQGTSLAASVVAGLAVLVGQYFHDGFYPSGTLQPLSAMRPTGALVKAVLVNSARDLSGANNGGHRPNSHQGWGSPRLDDTLYFAGDPTPWPDGTITERRRLLVLNDVPNGFDAHDALSPEPGGRTRDRIIARFKPGLTERQVHEFTVGVFGVSPGSLASELRLTLSWMDPPTSSPAPYVINNLDLEVVSPGDNGILESSAASGIGGDDVVYRPLPAAGTWADGFTRPSPHAALTTAANMSTPFSDCDGVNTIENIFVPASEVRNGTWLVRVIGRSVRAAGGTASAWPNFALGDQPPSRDLDGDGTPDTDEFDTAFQDLQGYALIASGPVFLPLPEGYVPIPPRDPYPPRPPRPPRRSWP